MSIGSVIVTPTPTAGPLIAPITGFVHRKMRSVSEAALVAVVHLGPTAAGDGADPSAASVLNVSPPPPRSAPAQKPRPATGDDDGAHVVVGVDPVEGVAQLALHRDGEGVEPVGPVEGDRRDAASATE